MASNGEGATFVGSGVGTLKEGGGARFTGALYFQSASATLSRLNSITVVFEHERGCGRQLPYDADGVEIAGGCPIRWSFWEH